MSLTVTLSLRCWITMAMLLAGSPLAASAQPYQPGVGFPILGIAAGQTVRVNALNLGLSSIPKPSSCTVTFRFLDAEGQILKETAVSLEPGKAASLDLSRGLLPGDGRVDIRAVLLFGYFGGANPPPEVLQRFDCNIVPSLEIYDDETERTTVILTNVTPLPPPASPAQ